MTVRTEIQSAARSLADGSSDGTFTPAEMIGELRRRGSKYPESTIRTHVTAHTCANAPKNAAVTYDDLERVAHRRCRLIDQR